MVVAMPIFMGLLVELMAPGFLGGLLANPLSVVLLAVAGGLQVCGFLAIRKLGEVRA
jgi:Flp pilus assembly protein TadB